jgi:hypothetical protein
VLGFTPTLGQVRVATFLIYVQPRQKLIISHKLTIGENFKLLNDINILQEEICEKQMLPNNSPTIVLLGYCPSLWNAQHG